MEVCLCCIFIKNVAIQLRTAFNNSEDRCDKSKWMEALKSKIVNFFRFCDFFLQTGSIQKGQNGVKKKNSKKLILVFFM